MATNNRKVTEKVPAVDLSGPIGEHIYEALQHDRYKEKIRAMIVEYTGTVEFEELIMKYAGKEYDNRILKSGRFWASTIIAAIVTSLVSVAITVWLIK